MTSFQLQPPPALDFPSQGDSPGMGRQRGIRGTQRWAQPVREGRHPKEDDTGRIQLSREVLGLPELTSACRGNLQVWGLSKEHWGGVLPSVWVGTTGQSESARFSQSHLLQLCPCPSDGDSSIPKRASLCQQGPSRGLLLGLLRSCVGAFVPPAVWDAPFKGRPKPHPVSPHLL